MSHSSRVAEATISRRACSVLRNVFAAGDGPVHNTSNRLFSDHHPSIAAAPRNAHAKESSPSPGQLLFLDVADIDWIEAASYYACLHVGRDTHIIRRTLAELERDLGEEKFIRIHRSIIVNLERIRGLELQQGGDHEVVLKSGERLRLSRRFRKRLQERMDLGSIRAGG